MATASQTKLLTAEEFMAADLGEGTFELVRGEVIEVPPPMPEHGRGLWNIRWFCPRDLWPQSGYGYALSNDSGVRDRARAGYGSRGATFASTATSDGHGSRWDRGFLPSARTWPSRSIPRAIGGATCAGEGRRSTSMPGSLWSGSSIPRAAVWSIYRSDDEPPDCS